MKDGALRVLALLRDIVALPKPVVGSIDGHVRAGGLGIVGACDIVLAGPKSTFAFSEVRLGLAAAMISLTTLPRLDPRAASRVLPDRRGLRRADRGQDRADHGVRRGHRRGHPRDPGRAARLLAAGPAGNQAAADGGDPGRLRGQGGSPG